VTTAIVQNATLVTRDDDKREKCEDIAAIRTPEEILEEKEQIHRSGSFLGRVDAVQLSC